MRDFAAIDFETANNERSSVCSIGIVVVRDGEIVETFYSLIQQNQTIITTGVVGFMVYAGRIPTLRQSFQRCGHR